MITLRRIALVMFVAGLVAASLAAYGFANMRAANEREQAFARFTPSPEAAHAALDCAMRSWQRGEPAGPIAGVASPAVFLVDNCRRPEQMVERYTILGEAAGDGPRCYAVRVTFSNPAEEQRLRFVVLGVDPLWVYRCEDYQMLMHWECGLDEHKHKADASKISK